MPKDCKLSSIISGMNKRMRTHCQAVSKMYREHACKRTCDHNSVAESEADNMYIPYTGSCTITKHLQHFNVLKTAKPSRLWQLCK